MNGPEIAILAAVSYMALAAGYFGTAKLTRWHYERKAMRIINTRPVPCVMCDRPVSDRWRVTCSDMCQALWLGETHHV